MMDMIPLSGKGILGLCDFFFSLVLTVLLVC